MLNQRGQGISLEMNQQELETFKKHLQDLKSKMEEGQSSEEISQKYNFRNMSV